MAFPPVPFQEWFLRQTSTGNAALNAYVARVKADGGVVEAIGCVPLAVWDWVAPVAPTLLLDLYPNAAAAYSLRKLRAAYSGSAVRVRKEVSSVSSETDIGFLADGTLDTVSLLSFASDADSGDVFVVTWYDQSLSNDATQSTAADQPKIVSGGSLVTENGKPAVDFDGVDDFLSHSPISGAALSAFTVSSSSDYSNFQAIISSRKNGNSFTNNGYVILHSNDAPTNSTIAQARDGSDFQISSFTNSLTAQRILSFINDGNGVGSSTQLLHENGSEKSNQSGLDPISYAAANDYCIGADNSTGSHFNGKISEVNIYSSDQSSNRTGVETNINDFYSIYP